MEKRVSLIVSVRYTKSAKGVAPIKQMLDQGIIVGLGTDGPSSGNTLDLFTKCAWLRIFIRQHTKIAPCFC